MAEEAAKRGGGALQRLVLWLLIFALLAAVWVLASERNQRHFRVVAENGQLVIERGRFFPMGSAPAADKIYAPVPLPAGEKAPGEMEFADQNALDQHLFGLLNGWARAAAQKNDTRLAGALVERASALPGLTGGQFSELATLRAELAWDDALAAVQQAAQLIEGAIRNYQLVAAGKGVHAVDAIKEAEWLQKIADQIHAAQQKPPAPSAAAPQK